jgi:prepilin-type N-terminal cleavage/methylation domain-containing protein
MSQLFQKGFTLIELLVVIVIIAAVWAAALPMLQPEHQRSGKNWLTQAQSLLMLSCDLSAQTLNTYRLLWQDQKLQLQVWQKNKWYMVSDVDALPLIEGWQVKNIASALSVKSDEQIAWLCRADGEQTAGSIMLQRSGLGELQLSWRGDGQYELR